MQPTPCGLTLRPSEPTDIGAIAAIYGRAVTEGVASFETEAPDEAEMSRRRDAILAGQFPYLVGCLGGRIAGYAYAGPYRARPAYRGTVENSVYVDAALQRRGVARALLLALIEACGAGGFRQMVAVIGDSANLASTRLHESAGFAPVGTLRSVGWKHGRWLDTVLMQRALGPGDTTPGGPPHPAARLA